MFIYSIKASTLKTIGIICVASILLLTVVLTFPEGDAIKAGAFSRDEGQIYYDKIKTPENRREFLKQFSWEVEPEAVEEISVKIPSDFDKVMNSYNDIQKSQGLDLSKYKGKTVTRYTYKITNYPNYEGTVFANIIIYKNKVISGDICSSDIEGFIHGLEKPKDK